ncbi:uncharacterized protein [Hemitrygon akajei]|uniref:uncharacterized protein n=1 Tax=Hemitrygon akajei TaxID=2704970 RepID=UPI003BF99EB5
MDTDLNSAISAFLSNCDDHQLFRLTRFYMERLEQAIEEGVEGVSFMLTHGHHFNDREYHRVTELAEKGNRAGASKLLLDLVMEKGSGAGRMMWESFVKLHHHLPKLSRILNEIRERGDGQIAYMDTERGLSEVPMHLKDVQQKHRETLRAQTATLRVNTILMREKVKVFQLVDRYAELTVIYPVRDRTLVEHELLVRGRDHEEWRENHLHAKLEKIQIAHLFHNSYSHSFWDKMKRFFAQSKSGSSAAVAGVPGIGKTTMVQKIVYDWATGKIYQQFQFVFSFKFRDLNSINCRINLKELILDQYPYFGNILREVWKNPEGLLFIFDGLDEFKHRIDFADSRRDTEPKHQCPDPEWWCEVSDIVYSLIQGKLLPGCSVLVTTRPTALHLLEKAKIGVWAEILGFSGEKRKEYFIRYFEDQTVAAAVFKHVKENEILYTMSYNPSYCWILALALGPFFTQRVRDPQRVPKTITQLYSYYIYNILKNHGREIENPRDVLLSVGQMAFRGVSEKRIVFTDGDLIKHLRVEQPGVPWWRLSLNHGTNLTSQLLFDNAIMDPNNVLKVLDQAPHQKDHLLSEVRRTLVDPVHMAKILDNLAVNPRAFARTVIKLGNPPPAWEGIKQAPPHKWKTELTMSLTPKWESRDWPEKGSMQSNFPRGIGPLTTVPLSGTAHPASTTAELGFVAVHLTYPPDSDFTQKESATVAPATVAANRPRTGEVLQSVRHSISHNNTVKEGEKKLHMLEKSLQAWRDKGWFPADDQPFLILSLLAEFQLRVLNDMENRRGEAKRKFFGKSKSVAKLEDEDVYLKEFLSRFQAHADKPPGNSVLPRPTPRESATCPDPETDPADPEWIIDHQPLYPPFPSGWSNAAHAPHHNIPVTAPPPYAEPPSHPKQI